MLRRILKKKYGANVGAAGVENPLTTPATYDFDAETTDATPSWITNQGTDTAVVKEESIEGHSKYLWLPGTNGAQIEVDLGGALDPTKGTRLQYLAYRGALYAPQFVWFENAADNGVNHLLHGKMVESATSHILRSIVRSDGNDYDTGDVEPGGGVNGTGNAWKYHRWEADPNGDMSFWVYSVSGALQSGYPINQAHAAGGADNWPTIGMDGMVTISDFYYELRIAEIWVGHMTDAWPTPGVPTT
jgi:hypothetical protein